MIHRKLIARALPFLLFIALLMLHQGAESLQASGNLDADWDLRWLYALRVVIPAIALAFFWRDYDETREGLSGRSLWLSIAAGLVVFLLWINLTASWMLLGGDEMEGGFVGLTHGEFDWPLITVRIIGAALLVPIVEELFWRSLVMRIIDRADFTALSPQKTSMIALLISSAVFAVEHQQWLAGIIAGLAYGGLYRLTGNLRTAIIAHAVTNAALAYYVIETGAWHFW